MRPDLTFPTGWIGIDDRQRAAAAQFPRLAFAAPLLMADLRAVEPKDPILLYRAWKDVLGDFPDYPAQQIGDCVSFGNAHANDLIQCLEIGLGEPSEYRETDTEFIYATSREVAGILGNSDGSYGAAAVKAMTTVGMVSREMLGPDGAYSGSRAKQWGRTGAPADVKRAAAPYRLGGSALVKTWDELVAAVINGYPVTLCSIRGFTLERDGQGFCRQSGQWGHCTFVAGVRFDRPGACIVQSWGRNVPEGPTDLGQPDYSFWADRKAIESMLSEGDSWALSKAPEFVKREVPKSWRYEDMA